MIDHPGLRHGNLAPPSVVDLVCRNARRQPDKEAYRFLHEGDGRTGLTYGELYQRAAAIGGQLQAMVSPGDRVLILCPPGLEYIEAFFGCLFAGALAVPACPPPPRRPAPRLQGIIADAKPALVLSTSGLHARLSDPYAQLPELSSLPWLATDQISTDRQPAWRDPGANHDTLAFLQYTSGSTASPKGVMVSHGNLLHNLAVIHQAFEVSRDDRGVFWLPLFHDMGLIGGVLQTVYAGATSTLFSPVDFLRRPLKWLQLISRHRAIVSGAPDFAYDLCVRKSTPETRAELDLSSWELAFVGAERVRPETIERFAETFAPCGFRREAFYPCYGLAEATLMVTGGRKQETPVIMQVRREALEANRVVPAAGQEADVRSLVGCGRAQSDHVVNIVDPVTRRVCAADQIGEIWVSSPSVARGYYNARQATESTFAARIVGDSNVPYLRTGDLGFLRDGELFVTGRLNERIIIRGRNYYPEDIEWSVDQSHPRLRRGGGAAFSVEVFGREELAVVAEVERHRNGLIADEVIAAVRRAVAADHEVDLHAVTLLKTGALPRTSSGKVRRRACRDEFLSGRLKAVASWAAEVSDDDSKQGQNGTLPGNGATREALGKDRSPEAIEDYLVELLSQRLGMPAEAFDVTQSFASFGISSVQAAALTAELEQWLGQPLSATFFYNYPSIAQLAEHLSRAKSVRAAPASSAPSREDDSGADATRSNSGLSEEAIEALITEGIPETD